MLILNFVLITAVIGVVLSLLSWAIISSRAEQPLTSQPSRPHPYARPHTRHPYWPPTYERQPRSRRSANPVAG
jgi:hypothetical protein